ncbi:hypothetical protein KEM48_004191 [Puccinia striiformis f. sp. tritici PST-130]|nr:hypothetical protein KEM48_004191 [Puccinia striiformis f. sp. tritici PST-130]
MPPGPARRKKTVKKGLGFVVGASGTGRTTFVNTLVDEKGWLAHADSSDPIAAAEGTSHIKVEKKTIELDEDGVTIRLTVCDAPGFGDNIENESAFSTIIGYLEKQYDDILAEESRIKRNPRFEDQRIHALLYFIPPTGHSLREMDIELMRRLSPRVNVIPVIGKADTLTPSELKGFKDRIMQDIEHYEIPIYNFPFDAEEDDDEIVAENSELRALLPFAIVGSENEIEAHSDFLRLRTALLSTHLTDLKEITHDFLYENYRTQTLSRGDADQLDQSIQPEDMANQSFRLKEEQLKKEEEKLKEIEVRVQREISEKRQELLAKEESLRSMEARLAHAGGPSE